MLDESISSDHEQLMKLHEEKSQLESRLNSLYETWENLAEEARKFN